MKETIKSCPFCGSAKVEIARTNEHACWVECPRCEGRSKSHPTRKGAIKNWNRRRPARVARVIFDDDLAFAHRLTVSR